MSKDMKPLLAFVAAAVVLPALAWADSKALDVSAVRAADHLGEQRYALVIGINDYRDPRIPDLHTSESDAQAV